MSFTADTARHITEQARTARGAVESVIAFVDRRIHAESLRGNMVLVHPLLNAPVTEELTSAQVDGIFQHYRDAGFKVEYLEDDAEPHWKISWE